MLSIQSRSGGSGAYYLATAAEAYYLGDDNTSEWLGDGARRLRLSGHVRDNDFLKAFRGYSPTGNPLVQNAGDKDRKAGWDLTYSLPKSAAVLWAVGDEKDRAAIERAHREGVKASLDYLERTAAFTRTGKAGSTVEPASLTVAAFHHGTSRAGDPGPHTHCVVMNFGHRDRGGTSALESHYFYLAKMTAGAVYQAKVSAELEKLGLHTQATTTPKGRFLGTFEVSGVPKAVCEFFSKRRQAIEEALKAKGHNSAAAAAAATLDTRPKKDKLPPREEMFAGWAADAASHGFTGKQARDLYRERRTGDELATTAKAIEEAKRELTASVSSFTERELYRATLVRTIGERVEPSFVEKAVKTHLESSGDIVSLGGFRLAHRFTTKQVWETEKELLASAQGLADRRFDGLRRATVEEHVEKTYRPDTKRPGFTLKEEQKEAVRKLTEAGGDIRVLSGYAGTGKTAVLRAVREAYERDGYTVLGASVAGAAAEQLEKGSGIRSDTVAMRFIEMNRSQSLGKSVWHHTKQMLKTAANEFHRDLRLPVYKLRGPLVIDKGTVLVVDEAGMLGTEDLAKLVRAAKDGGGKLILVGDHRQLPAIEPGGGFRSLANRVGFFELGDVTRQRSAWGRQKTKDLAEGEAEKVLREAAERNLLTVGRDREATVRQLVADWSKKGLTDPKENMMIASTNADVMALNTLAQRERRQAPSPKATGSSSARTPARSA